jgi:hypothetical protein
MKALPSMSTVQEYDDGQLRFFVVWNIDVGESSVLKLQKEGVH